MTIKLEVGKTYHLVTTFSNEGKVKITFVGKDYVIYEDVLENEDCVCLANIESADEVLPEPEYLPYHMEQGILNDKPYTAMSYGYPVFKPTLKDRKVWKVTPRHNQEPLVEDVTDA